MSGDSGQGSMHVGLIAPWGIGKTSVVAALLEEANDVLAGSPVKVEAAGPTRKRLNALTNQIRGHLRAGEFVAGGIHGTQDLFQFSLSIQAVGTDRQFMIEIMDYPGGVLDEQEGEKWERVKRWLRRADALVIPIDAALIMEAVTPRQHRQVEEALNISEIEALAAREWAKERVHNGQGAGLLVLAPVKCETYFADNGGTTDRSATLYQRVMETYGSVVAKVTKEAPGTTVLFCPIDTLGCVEVMRVEWPKDGQKRPEPHYRVRGEPTLSRRGAADLFVKLIDRLLSGAEVEQAALVDKARTTASRAQDAAETDFGVLRNFWVWLSGAREELRDAADEKREAADRETEALTALVATLEEVRRKPMGSRSRVIGQ